MCLCIVVSLSISSGQSESATDVVLSLELELIPNWVRVRVHTLGLGFRAKEGLAPRVKSRV